MLTIDTQNMLDEKRTKELKTSLNEFIATIIKAFNDKILQSNIDKIEYSFKLEFDNENLFYITSLKNNNSIISEYGYIDRYGNYKDTLTLQEALNINKYIKDIEFNIKKYLQNNDIIFTGYFTMQNIDKNILIFHEHNVNERSKNYKNEISYVKIINPKSSTIER